MIKCIRYELYKFLVVNRGWIIVLIFIVLQIFSIANNGFISNSEKLPQTEITLAEYYGRWSGKLNETSIVEIEAHNNKLTFLDIEIDRIYSEMDAGKISEFDGRELLKEKYELSRSKRVFNKFYYQYQYVKENPTDRELHDLRGWNILYSFYQGLDYLLIFLVLIASASIFSSESEESTSYMVKTTRLGYKKVVLAKILSVILIILSACVLTLVIEAVTVNAKFSLSNGNAAIQSMDMFGMFPFRVSILLGVGILFLIQVLGLLLMSLICALIAQVNNKGYLGLFVGLGIVILPYFLFSENLIYYKTPLPTGLISPLGYFRYTVFETPPSNQQFEILLDQNDLVLNFSLCHMLLVIFIFIIIRNYSSKGLSGKARSINEE